MNKHDFPKIHFYDQDFVDIYNKSWNMLSDYWIDPKTEEKSADGYLIYPVDGKFIIDQFESIFSSFFLVYSHRNFDTNNNIDYFYARQEENGAICWKYDVKTNQPLLSSANPEGIGMPLFAWAEFNLYHKSANTKRINEVMPVLQKYMNWIDATFKQENGLYAVPAVASTMMNAPRENVYYPVDFNAAMAINASHMSALGDILNDKDLSFQYRRMYFSIKTRINSLMWDNATGFYHDLDKDGNHLIEKTIAGFWPLLAEIPNADKSEMLIAHLNNPTTFGTEHPFPTLSADSPNFMLTHTSFIIVYLRYDLCLSAMAKPSSGAHSLSRAAAASISSGERSSIAMLVITIHPFSFRWLPKSVRNGFHILSNSGLPGLAETVTLLPVASSK